MNIKQWQKEVILLFAIFYVPLNVAMDTLYTNEEKNLIKNLMKLFFIKNFHGQNLNQ